MSNAYIGHGMRDEIHLMKVGKRNNLQGSLYAIQKVERGRQILDGNMGEGEQGLRLYRKKSIKRCLKLVEV